MDALKQQGLLPTKRNGARIRPAEDVGTTGTEQIARELLDAAEESTERPKAYLRRRGINSSPSVLKLVSAGVMHFITGKMLPAMIAPITDKDRRIIGVHVTYLTADARSNGVGIHGKVRRIYGELAGGLVVLQPADPEQPFILGEGIETVLSAMQITGFPGAAALSATNLPKIAPPKCSEVIIAADADKPGIEAAEQLAGRLTSAGHKVRIAAPVTPGNDWNDELRSCHNIKN
ncbi:TROPIM superfamily domain-containing protein [Sinorhizobium fredii]|uniref:TROPIM superfamily domain-containing protein n=2 Tax=Rhizobium fredii TaxID=380 RepID=A0A2L0H9E8_RHIFR|nr:TROPIM superfamily domain-containing protein [Sinorhizobium fredii]